MIDHIDCEERAEPIEPDEPTENADAKEPTLPIDAHDPMLPIESTDPVDAIDSIELRDHNDQRLGRLVDASAPSSAPESVWCLIQSPVRWACR